MWSVVLYPWSLQGASILMVFAKNFLLWVYFRKNKSPLWPAILTTMGAESQCVKRKGLCSSKGLCVEKPIFYSVSCLIEKLS